MPNSGSLIAYPDVKEVLDRALTSVRGVRVSFNEYGAARRFQGRCNSFRKLDRKNNAKIYPDPTHMLHDRSPYDSLVITMKGNAVEIVVRQVSLTVEELT